MKAERRHELQENSLAKFIENLPIILRLYADKILLGIVIVLLVYFLIHWRMNVNASRTNQIANDLAGARTSVRALANLRMIGPPEKIASDRSQLMDDVNRAIESIASSGSSADNTLQANALLTKGDLNWTLANLPPITGAATQPALQLPATSNDYLAKAEQAYQQVIKTFPDQKDAALKAQFALAAIAENRHDWDGATKIYEQIKQAGDVDQMYKDLADARIKLIPEIKQPVLLGALTEKPADLAPLVMAPSSQPSTKPTTAPATQPAK
jgi:hypothetical protein